MLSLLKHDKIFILGLIPFIAAGIWINQLITPGFTPMVFDSYPMPLYKLLRSLTAENYLLANSISLVLLTVNAYVIIRINGANQITNKSTFLPGVLFVMLASTFTETRQCSPMLFASFFLLIPAHRLFSTYKEKSNLRTFFEAGIFVGLASLFYFNAIFFFIYLIFATSILRTFYWREYLVPLLGLIVVYSFVFTYYFYYDATEELLLTMQNNLLQPSDLSFLHLSNKIFLGYLLFVFLIALFVSFTGIVKKILVRKIYVQFLVWFSLVIGMFFFIPATGGELMIFMAVPLSLFLSNYLLNIYSIPLSEIIFMTFTGLFIFSQFNVG